MPSLSPLVINYRHSQPSVVAHPRELMVGYSMGYGVGALFSLPSKYSTLKCNVMPAYTNRIACTNNYKGAAWFAHKCNTSCTYSTRNGIKTHGQNRYHTLVIDNIF